jgi:Fe-S cluster assembly iron-binding protein IscA
MSLEETEELGDTVVEVEGIRFVLDPQAFKYAEGATVDYRQSIFGKGFTVKTSLGGNC